VLKSYDRSSIRTIPKSIVVVAEVSWINVAPLQAPTPAPLGSLRKLKLHGEGDINGRQHY
jgi:hypothetical protein